VCRQPAGFSVGHGPRIPQVSYVHSAHLEKDLNLQTAMPSSTDKVPNVLCRQCYATDFRTRLRVGSQCKRLAADIKHSYQNKPEFPAIADQVSHYCTVSTKCSSKLCNFSSEKAEKISFELR
jgi:hypothetical protein